MRRFYCVLGDPVAHSRSPAIHARAFARLGLDAVFAPCRVTAAELPAAVSGLRSLGCAGFNVTVPHKTAVAGLVDRLEGDAARIAAVNCVAPQGTALVGHNTDTAGLLRALRQHGIDPSGKAVVVGAGGSARAAAFALAGRASSVAILNRTEARAAELARAVSDAKAYELGTEPARRALQEAAIVVQCTTVGLSDDSVPFDPAQLSPGAAVVDLVYRLPGGDTELLRRARKRGLRAVDGIDVLVHQAIASLEIWLGRTGLDDLFSSLREAALS
ncbi:MAG: shikimate dehydrogenase [Deltaproteobacteria bacterium]|nr:MAG: shikimate dehydrogenase [Deltaproteobacteria bacterium]